jgi:hypothetical protein
MHYYGSSGAAHLTHQATHDWPPTPGVTGFHFHLGRDCISWRAGTQELTLRTPPQSPSSMPSTNQLEKWCTSTS